MVAATSTIGSRSPTAERSATAAIRYRAFLTPGCIADCIERR